MGFSSPYEFKLYNEDGIEISKMVTFIDKENLENEIIERINKETTGSKAPEQRLNWTERYFHDPAIIRKEKSSDTDVVEHLNRNASVYVIIDSLDASWTALYSNRNIDSKIGYVHTNLLKHYSLPDLQVTEVKLSRRGHGHGFEVSGSVRNNSNRRYSFVQVRISWMNSNEDVVDTSSTYAVGSEGIFPGESSAYSYFTRRTDIHSVSVSILNYQ